ncbi:MULTISPECIES: polysaccharide biosynthesis C-terminal domain-containing protein [unclassified Methanosarcina]|uniref:polysaccharide biosynthesis C-terminal domain-containing protein n=1 Tax=unclassified Methanosarcina TaxID=2644672 RepID=UPI000615B6D8|nr:MULTISPECIES: polysaccharide biosynthesis C-terminal domain-containing protein [unclassified Methanosarcina]AKB18589.1 Heteropolysaccharide repeat unit export protein [Methanosarcina sp. WWM596]
MVSGDSDFLRKCSVASAGISAVLNFVLIPQYGMIGVAAAFSVSFTFRDLNDLECLEVTAHASFLVSARLFSEKQLF